MRDVLNPVVSPMIKVLCALWAHATEHMGWIMYVKREKGPASVTLPDGSIMTRSDLPEPKTRRWVASRKAAVVKGVAAGLISKKDACELYGLTDEELTSWASAIEKHGLKALKTTRLQDYRQL